MCCRRMHVNDKCGVVKYFVVIAGIGMSTMAMAAVQQGAKTTQFQFGTATSCVLVKRSSDQ
jgi:hypothetical protein